MIGDLSQAGLTLDTISTALGATAAAATLAAAASAVTITAEGNRIILNFADLNAALELWKPWGSPAKRADFLRRFENMLERLNVAIEFRVEGKLLDGFGPGTRPGLLRRIIV
jgi:hypothetical protein